MKGIGRYGLALLLGIGMMPAWAADSPYDLVVQGNRAFEKGDYGKAVECFRSAAEDEHLPNRFVPLYNEGIALYRQAKFDEGLKVLDDALEQAKLPAQQARAEFCKGNCLYKQAQGKVQAQDLEGAVELLKSAAECYHDAYAHDSGLSDAAHNLETTRLTMKTLMDEIRKRKEAAEKQQAQQEAIRKKLKKLTDDQKKLNADTTRQEKQDKAQDSPKSSQEKQGDAESSKKEAASDQKNQNAAGNTSGSTSQQAPESDQKDALKQLADRQDDLKQQARELASQMQSLCPQTSQQKTSGAKAQPDNKNTAPTSPMESARKEVERAAALQDTAAQKLRKGEKPDTEQQQALDALKKAWDALNQKCENQNKDQQGEKGNQQKQQQKQGGQQSDKKKQGNQKKQDGQNRQNATGQQGNSQQKAGSSRQDASQGKEQKSKLVKGETSRDIINEELKNKKRRVFLLQQGYTPVDKDW